MPQARVAAVGSLLRWNQASGQYRDHGHDDDRDQRQVSQPDLAGRLFQAVAHHTCEHRRARWSKAEGRASAIEAPLGRLDGIAESFRRGAQNGRISTELRATAWRVPGSTACSRLSVSVNKASSSWSTHQRSQQRIRCYRTVNDRPSSIVRQRPHVAGSDASQGSFSRTGLSGLHLASVDS